MVSDPLVSIVIPTFNCPYIASSIKSVLNQSYPRTEVIVVNDGSTKYIEKIKPYFGKIKYIEKENGGTGSALNMGIKLAQGEYFTWLSSDDLYESDKVSKQVAFMRSVGSDVSYTACYHINEKNNIIKRNGLGFPDKTKFYKAMLKKNFINGCTVMIRKKVFDKVGIFNENLRCTQDYDMWCRILQYYDFHYLDKPLVRYRVHSKMGSKKLRNIIDQERTFIQQKYKTVFMRLIKQGNSG